METGELKKRRVGLDIALEKAVFYIRRDMRRKGLKEEIITGLELKRCNNLSQRGQLNLFEIIFNYLRVATLDEFLELYYHLFLPKEWKCLLAVCFKGSPGQVYRFAIIGKPYNAWQRIFYKELNELKQPTPPHFEKWLAKLYDDTRENLKRLGWISEAPVITTEEITLYRGVSKIEAVFAKEKQWNQVGVWWAFDEECAKWFNDQYNKEDSKILVTKVKPQNITHYGSQKYIGFYGENNTRTAVIFPEEISDFSVSIID